MHRSGTSLVASWLSALGVDMGQNLLPADKSNPRGYFEDVDFLQFQRTMLSESCLPNDGGHPDWGWTESEQLNKKVFKDFRPAASEMIASQSKNRKLWGWKDPRTTLLLDFWDSLLEDAKYIFVYRFPWDVADSMQRLGAPVFLQNPEYAYRIWTFYNQHLLDFFTKNSQRCLLVSSNALQQNPDLLIDLLRKKLNIEIREAKLKEIYENDLFTSTDNSDPLIDLVAAASPQCTKLLMQLDDLANVSSAGLWQAQPPRSRLRKKVNSSTSEIDVTVVIPCFDSGQFMLEAVASFERVAAPNYELVIVNDGSKERRTLEILKILKDAGYFIIDQENQGLSAARNAGIRSAAGRYILPLDADNRLRAGFIETAVKILNSMPDVGVVYGFRQFFGLKNNVDEVPEFDLDELLTFNYIDACAVFRKQTWADCGGYDQKMSPLEDWDLWIGASEKAWKFHRLQQITFDYRVRPESLISMVDNPEFLDQLLASMMIKHYELYEPRFVKQLAKMKRSSAHLVASINRLSEENEVLRKELSAANERRNLEGRRLIILLRRVRKKLFEYLTSLKNRFRKKSS
jgi:glycosyltransferase involved in cell wall biosynthesis